MKTRFAASIRSTVTPILLLFLSESSFADLSGAAAEREFNAVVQLKADAVHGEQVFDTCAACHGTKGTGLSDGTVPAIAGQHFRVIVWEIVSFRHGQRTDPRMQHFTDRQHLSGNAQDIADVAAYVNHMQPSVSASATTPDHRPRDDDIYRHNCGSCHGPDARGDDQKRNPRLAGQNSAYLLRRLEGGIESQHTYTSARHGQLRRRLTAADLSAICEFLAKLRSAPAQSPITGRAANAHSTDDRR